MPWALATGGSPRQGGDRERERGPGLSHVPFIEVGGEAAVASGRPTAPARAAAAAAPARPAAASAAPAAAAASTGASARAAAARASAPMHRGHRRCRRRCRCCSRCRRRGEVGAALGLGAGGHQPRGRGRLVAGAGGRGGLGALRGGLMDLQDKSREGRPKGTGCECSCCGAGPPGGAPPEMPPRGPGEPSPSRADHLALLPASPVVPSCVSAASWGACRTCRTSCTDRAYRRCGRAYASSCRCCWRSAGRSPRTHTGKASPLWTRTWALAADAQSPPPRDPHPPRRGPGLREEERGAIRAWLP